MVFFNYINLIKLFKLIIAPFFEIGGNLKNRIKINEFKIFELN